MPQPRRTCIVTLIPKLRGVRNVSQYRPLALTDIMAKISCNVLHTRLRIRLPYLMPPWSLGCRAGSSCTHVLFLHQQLIEKTGEWDISLLLVGHLTVFFGNPCMSASLSWLVKTWQRPTSLYGPLGAVYLGEGQSDGAAVEFKRGALQSDLSSPSLFNIIMVLVLLPLLHSWILKGWATIPEDAPTAWFRCAGGLTLFFFDRLIFCDCCPWRRWA